MRVTVVIPAYNSSATIRETLDSVLAQTAPADEILVMDDGSTDDTAALVCSYLSQVTLMRQTNRGPAATRNALCLKASGDLIAFLDSDDVWHPHYLEVQRQLFANHPSCVASFVGHVSFCGKFDHQWNAHGGYSDTPELIAPAVFLRRINWEPGPFGISYCCVPRSVINAVGPEPFKFNLAEDLYFHERRAPLGPVVYLPRPLAAYRLRQNSLSSSRLPIAEAMTCAVEYLAETYSHEIDPALAKILREALAMKRRHYAKLLLANGSTKKAREILAHSLTCCGNPTSVAKSAALLLAALMPNRFQPNWTSPELDSRATGVPVTPLSEKRGQRNAALQ